ncbi:type IV toxin-antitoxin system AbiEi family antitoxin domain-containing protein [Frigoribacterium sp. CFBP 8766]|jgi:very-short-patch-repair endonuclease|nr:type IV toxin-antitoxin system AbiEi family antitoxin domain-containing protein [Frigoribacterium sp. CFBP 8766]
MDLSQTLAAFGGIATRRQLLASGHSGGDLTTAVQRGEVRRARHGHYARLDAATDAVAAVRLGGRLAGPSAASVHGLWAGYDRRLHVSVPRNASRLRDARRATPGGGAAPRSADDSVVVHWTDTEPLDLSEPCWLSPVVVCLRQMVAWCDEMTAVACVDTALQASLVGLDELTAGLEGHGPRARAVLRRCRPGSDSGVESIVRQALAARGVEVEQQVVVTSVGPSDMRLRGRRGQALRALVELDGFAFHSRRDAFDRDRRKDAEAASAGYTTLRFSADQIERDLGEVIDTIVRVRDAHDAGKDEPKSLSRARFRTI